jgi:hypothetical protein
MRQQWRARREGMADDPKSASFHTSPPGAKGHPRGLTFRCSDKAGNIYSAPLNISRVDLLLLNFCFRQGHWRPMLSFYAAGAGGITTAETSVGADAKL